MKLTLHSQYQGNEALIIPVFKGEVLSQVPENLSQPVEHLLKQLKRTEKKVASFNQLGETPGLLVMVDYDQVGKLEVEAIRRRTALALKPIKEAMISHISILHSNMEDFEAVDFFRGIVEGLLFAAYSFRNYKGKDKRYKLKEVVYTAYPEELHDSLIEQGKESEVLAKANYVARDLVNEPANIIYPKTLAKRVEELGEDHGFETEVFKEDAIEKLGMDAFLEVAKGSKKGPRLIVMRYFGGSEDDKVLGLVGKGLTYDSGGYSIKPTNGMVNMKTDMGGSAAVIGAMVAIAEAKLPINVVAVVAACENMISDKAYKPGDVIGSMGGKTIVVENTDAEGRLTLIDAVYYARTVENVDEVIDIATLTGAQAICLGSERAGVVSNNDNFYERVEDASRVSGEKIWRLPHDKEYAKLLESPIADLRNIGGREAGTITAGLFIGAFVEDTPWVHIDIASPSYVEKAKYYYELGATGFGARLLYEVAKNK